jgi:menaquinone-dependent protoporphyrinogen oxidase
MKFLIAYGTSEGQTRKIAEAAAVHLHDLGHDGHLFDTASSRRYGHQFDTVSSPMDLHMDSYDRIVVAGSVHHRRHQESVEVFIMANFSELQKKPTLFLSVSLSAAFAEGMKEAWSYVRAFLASTGWKPTRSVVVAGALRYAEYDYFKQQIIEHIVLKGRASDAPVGDYEFTDWKALFRVIDAFVQS